MKSQTKRVYCPPSLPVTGFTLTLTDAYVLRDSLARTLKDFEHALAEWPKDVEANRADFEKAAVFLANTHCRAGKGDRPFQAPVCFRAAGLAARQQRFSPGALHARLVQPKHMNHRTGKHWTHCDKCEQPNPNWEWSNYCPVCRKEFYRQNNIQGFWVPEDQATSDRS